MSITTQMLNPKITTSLLAVVCAGAALSYYAFQNEPLQNEPAVVISRGDIQSTVITTGVLKPIRQISVGAQVNGQLKKLHVHQGDLVKQGQLLAEIDPVLQQTELRKSEAELKSAQAQWRSSTVLLKQYQLALRRQKRMAAEGSGVQSDLEEAQAQFDSQREQLNVNRAQIVQSEMAVETAKANVGYTRILAPIDGEILGIVTQEGQTIVSSQTAPTLMVIADLSVMRIHTRISETDILKIHPGQKLWFYVVADPSLKYQSIMGEIQNAPDDALKDSNEMSSGAGQPSSAIYYNGVFDIANDDRLLKTSMTAQVFVVVSEAKDVLRLPLAVLGEKIADGEYPVDVRRDGKLIKQKIKVGVRDNNYVEVRSGLTVGDLVVSPLLTEKGEMHE